MNRQLAKTADGVLVPPGTVVFWKYNLDLRLVVRDSPFYAWRDHGPSEPISECYSTREAAEAAATGGQS